MGSNCDKVSSSYCNSTCSVFESCQLCVTASDSGASVGDPGCETDVNKISVTFLVPFAVASVVAIIGYCVYRYQQVGLEERYGESDPGEIGPRQKKIRYVIIAVVVLCICVIIAVVAGVTATESRS